MKYIMLLKVYADGTKRFEPVIFSDNLVHADVAEALLATEQLKGFTVASAGEVNITCDSTHGESTTLKINADKTDRHRINFANYGGLWEDGDDNAQ